MLDERKEKAITQILLGDNITSVAKIVSVSRTTIYEWLGDAEFKEEMERRRQEIIKNANGYVLAHTLSLLEVIHNLAVSTTDKRTAFVAAAYLVDRALGKTKFKLDINKDDVDKDFITQDMLAQELDEFDAEN